MKPNDHNMIDVIGKMQRSETFKSWFSLCKSDDEKHPKGQAQQDWAPLRQEPRSNILEKNWSMVIGYCGRSGWSQCNEYKNWLIYIKQSEEKMNKALSSHRKCELISTEAWGREGVELIWRIDAGGIPVVSRQ